ncbi:MAG: hypothetical protein Q9177_004613 [Variospora cf. flavescens]
MDLHRCRFVPYPPSAINALAFSHPSSLTTSSKGSPTLRLAIGKANGDLEIWNPLRGAWHQECVFRGGKDRSIEGLAWTQDPEEEDKNGFKVAGRLRLFSIGYSTSVTEWDLATGRPLRHASGNYGELWCMAAQPRLQVTPNEDTMTINGVEMGIIRYQSLVVGCADGSIVLLSTADGDLQFQRTLTRPPKRKARVLSITWQNRHLVIAGHADSTIRVFDTRNGQQIRSMSLGAGPQGGPKEILVWSVKCRPDGTIVSGDSTGTVSFWDARHYSRLQRITSHKADILDLAISANGETVFSGGMDRRTTLYRQTAGSKPGEKKRWAEIAHQRFHAHDVKAMAVFETKKTSILASGGLDTTPIIVPVREFGREHHRTLSSLPQQPPVRSAPRKGLLVSWWDREVNIWRILRSKGSHDAAGVLEGLPHPPEKKLVAKVLLRGAESITSADVLQDGSLLAVSTLSDIKMFRLRERLDTTMSLRKIDLPDELAKVGAKAIQVSPDGKWMSLTTNNNKIQLHRISKLESPKDIPRVLPQPINLRRLPRKPALSNYLHGSLGAYDRSIIRTAFSANSRILVVGDLAGHLDTWVLEGNEDLSQDPPVTSLDNRHRSSSASSLSSSSSSSSSASDSEAHPTLIYAQHWRRNPTAHLIPKLPSAPLIMSFRPANPFTPSDALTNGTTVHPTRHTPHPHSHDLPHDEARLFILTAEHQVYEFDVLAGKMTDWSRRNPTSTLPPDFRALRDRAMGCVWDIAAPSSSSASSPPPVLSSTGSSTAGRCQERIWLYGSAWLWMFDLSQDFPERADEDASEGDEEQLASNSNKKRKRGNRQAQSLARIDDIPSKKKEKQKRRKIQESGAGGTIPAYEVNAGIGRSMRKTVGPAGDEARIFALGQGGSDSTSTDEEEDEDVDEDNEPSSALIKLRRGKQATTTGLADEKQKAEDGVEMMAKGEGEQEKEKERRPYWGTYKYRPILGIVPIGEGGSSVEVALVERPMFEVDLPGRYFGDQEWEERKDGGGGVI